jgi:hypothetical protein
LVDFSGTSKRTNTREEDEEDGGRSSKCSPNKRQPNIGFGCSLCPVLLETPERALKEGGRRPHIIPVSQVLSKEVKYSVHEPKNVNIHCQNSTSHTA